MSVEISITDQIVEINETSTPVEIYVSAGASSSAVWGGITGTLSNQTDLQNALNLKVPYAGATTNVNLGAFDLLVQGITIGKGNNSLVNNTALGHFSLSTITTGNFNTAVGYESLRNTTTGQYNTAIGQSSLFSNTTGGQNTALGLNALLLNTSGASNVAVGLDTLQHITTGSSNTAIGYNAGSHITGGSTPNTTASNSVFIGRDSKAAADAQTNQIVIGQNAVGNGSNTVTIGNSSNTANYFTGSINGGSFVKSGGLSTEYLKADGSVSTLTNPITGTGLAGQVAYFTGATTQAGSNNLFWDNTNGRLGIGTASPSNLGAITIAGNLIVRPNGTAGVPVETSLRFFGASDAASGASITTVDQSSYSIGLGFFTRNVSTVSEKLRIFNNGNVLIQNGGTFTDSGQRLQVTGNTLLSGNLTLSNVGNTIFTFAGAGSFSHDAVGTGGQLVYNPASGIRFKFAGVTSGFIFGATSNTQTTATTILISSNVGVNSNVFQSTVTPNFTGSGDAATISLTGTVGLDAINNLSGGISTGIKVAETFAPNTANKDIRYIGASIQPTINQSGGLTQITRGLYVNPTLTSAFDFRAIEVSAGVTVLAASVTARASLRIPSGTAPTSPVNGDIWFDGTNLQMRIGGITRTFTLI
jgi:hypothetical protein